MATNPQLGLLKMEVSRKHTLKRSSTKEINFHARQMEAKEWIEKVLSLKLDSDDLGECLRDGVILCKLMLRIDPGCNMKEPRETSQPFKMMQNLEYFIQACRAYGVSNCFIPAELVNKTNLMNVIMTIHSLADVASKKGFKPTLVKTNPFLVPEVLKKPEERLVQRLGREREIWIEKMNQMKNELEERKMATLKVKNNKKEPEQEKKQVQNDLQEQDQSEENVVNLEENQEGKKIDYGGETDPGTRYNGLNQDTFICLKLENQYSHLLSKENMQKCCYLWGVFDGHSQLGEQASRISTICFEEFLKREIVDKCWKKGIPFEADENILKQAFLYANDCIIDFYKEVPKEISYPIDDEDFKFILKEEEGDMFYVSEELGEERMVDFGTTAVLAILINDILVVANVGDSEAAIGRASQGQLRGIILSERHSCDSPEEVERIQKEFPETEFSDDGYIVVTHKKINEYYLAMTRALGHKWLNKCGVSPVPFVTQETLTERELYLVLASDGVWEEMDADMVMEFVEEWCSEGYSAQQASRMLVDKALEMADEDDKDNTTAVVVYL